MAVGVVAILASTVNLLHVIIEWFKNPPDRYFVGISHFFADFFLYTSWIAQGEKGNLLAYPAFTDEPMAPTWYHFFYPLLGNIGNALGLSPFATYNWSLLLLTILLIVLWWKLCTMLFPHNRLKRWLGFLFVLTASGFIHYRQFLQTGYGAALVPYWYAPTLAFNRLGGVPHHLFISILLVSVLLLSNHGAAKPGWRLALLVGAVLIIALINPIQAILLAFAIVLGHRRRGLALLLASVGVGAWLSLAEIRNVAVLNASLGWENDQWTPVTLANFPLVAGPILILALLGIWPYVKKLDALRTTLGIYGVSTLVLFFSPLPTLLGIPRVRFLHPVPYGLLAVLAVEGIVAASALLRTVMYRLFHRHFSHFGFPLCRLLTSHTSASLFAGFSLLFLYLLFTIPSLVSGVTARTNPVLNPNGLLDTDYNHVPMPWMRALAWLKNQPMDGTRPVVMVDHRFRIEVLVPPLTGRISFSGHPVHTIEYEKKEARRVEFFTKAWTEEELRAFLDQHRIGAIITRSELAQTNSFRSFPFIELSYDREGILIYTDTDRVP